jgi:hypothetical protein
VFPAAAAANRPIFYHSDGRARSLAGVMDLLNSKMGRALARVDGDTSRGERAFAPISLAAAAYSPARNGTPARVAQSTSLEPATSPAPGYSPAPVPRGSGTGPMRSSLSMSAMLRATFGGDGGPALASPEGAAQVRRAAGAARGAVLDVDVHHGNGTQDIFYDRGDVFFASIHGAPEDCFPYFLGYGDETGQGAGAGANANYPLPPGTGYGAWSAALDAALARIAAHGAEALVVSLGVDAFVGDPISAFRLESADFIDMGARIARAGLPTVFCMEGGYAIEEVGVNTVNTLEGFCG